MDKTARTASPDRAGDAVPAVGRLLAAQLARRCTIDAAALAAPAESDEVVDARWQPRAVDAFRFAIGMAEPGYNVFAMGSEGVGRRTLARRFLDRAAGARPTPADWCYVFNFRVPHQPRAIALAAGQGAAFKRDMERLVDDLHAGIVAALEADDYRSRRQEIEGDLSRRQEQVVETISERARARGVGVLRTPAGFGFAPLMGDEIMPPEKFQALSDDERKAIETAIAEFQLALERALEDIPKLRRDAQHRLRELDRQVMHAAIRGPIDELARVHAAQPEIGDYLREVEEDVVDHAPWFQQPKEAEGGMLRLALVRGEIVESPLRRYAVNLLVDHSGSRGAPIVYEDHPTHDNLVGRVEHVSRMGALVTDFTLIKPGALHRANGGYLIVDALKLLTQPLAWEALKRALRSRQLAIESLGQAIGLVSTQSLEPEPIPLDLRVVLVGQRELYYRLHELDSEFARLFKVVADFRDHVERTGATEQAYAQLVAAIARDKGLRPLDRAGLGRVIEHAASMAESADRLSLHMSGIVALLEEADHCAEKGAHPVVTDADVQQALDAQRRRADRIVVEMRDEMLSGRLLVATEGDRVGQVNGLTIAALGGFRFGLPVRITARARLGHGGVIDLEREAELGGPIHSKSMLIVAGYLAARYAPNVPLSLSATLVFEQTYGAVEGDSASLAEVCALLSALADTPLSNAIAVTGSINQHGDVQAVGAVNEKVEGFFDLCALRGLDGRQGAIVPSSNVGQLMLRPDLVEAVAAGRFAVYAVDSVDAAMQVLTGLDAGQRDAMNRFPAGSLNARIEERLVDFAERARAFASPARKHGRLHEAG